MSFTQVLNLLNVFNQISLEAIVVSKEGVFKYTNHDGIIVYHTLDNKHYRYFL